MHNLYTYYTLNNTMHYTIYIYILYDTYMIGIHNGYLAVTLGGNRARIFLISLLIPFNLLSVYFVLFLSYSNS